MVLIRHQKSGLGREGEGERDIKRKGRDTSSSKREREHSYQRWSLKPKAQGAQMLVHILKGEPKREIKSCHF